MKTGKRILALVLAALTAFALCACGEKKVEELPREVYVPEFFGLQTDKVESDSEGFEVDPSIVTERGYYGYVPVKVGERELEPGEELFYDGQLDVYEQRLCFVDFDGKVSPMEGFRELTVEVDEEHGYSCYQSGNATTGMLPDGGLLMLVQVDVYKKTKPDFLTDETYVEQAEPEEKAGEEQETGTGTEEDGEEQPQPAVTDYTDYFVSDWEADYRCDYYLRELDETGAERSCVLLNLDKIREENPFFYLTGMTVLDEQRVLIAADSKMLVIDRASGEIKKEISNGDDWWIQHLTTLKDGRTAVIYAEYSPRYCVYAAVVDPDSGKLENVVELNRYFNFVVPCFDDRYDFCFIDGSKLYGFQMSSGTCEAILDWINCDVNPNSINCVVCRPDGVVSGVFYDYQTDSRMSLMTLRLVDRSTLPEREIVTLAYANDPGLFSAIIRFNREHQDVRIELRSYVEYNTEDQMYGGATKLKTEMLAGNTPDILILNGLDFRQLAARGLLADLYPLLDADAELSREDILPAAARALEYDGKLLRMASTFQLSFAVGLKEKVGDRNGWTYSEALQALKALPEGGTFLSSSETRESMLEVFLSSDADSFINWQTGEVSFDSEEFISLLKLTKTMPAQFDYENYEWSEDDYDFTRVLTGKQLLSWEFFYDYGSVINLKHNFGNLDKLATIGLPNRNASGIVLNLDSAVAICEASKHKEAAWQFVREYLTGNMESDYGYGFSTNVRVFEKKLEEAKTIQYEVDESGRAYVDPETGEKVKKALSGYYDEETSEYVEIYSMSEDEARLLEQIIDNASPGNDRDLEILNIVNGQVEAYFSGQRSAEETAKIIQNKVQLYVNENR